MKNQVSAEKKSPVRSAAAFLVLAAFALIIYLPSFSAPFFLDDWGSIVDNQYIRVRDLKPSTLLGAAMQNGLQNRPLSNLSFALNYYFNGIDPLGYHLVNFIFFCLTALGVFLLLMRLLARLGFDRTRSFAAAWLSALVWVSHPLNTQAVTYIVQRHVVFSGAFSIWSLYFFHAGMESKKFRRSLFSLCGLCLFCALLCKETAASLPALIFLYKLYFFDELKPGWLKRNAKWLIALLFFYGLGAAAILRPGMLALLQHDFARNHISAWGKFLSAPRSLFWYLCLIVFPFPQFLSLFHEFPLSTGLLHPATTLLSWLALPAAVVAALALARRQRIFSFAALWYLGSLSVEAMPLPIDLVNEHRLYLAMLGLIVPACSWPVLKAKDFRPALAFAVVVALFFGWFSFSRNQVWTSSMKLWVDVLEKIPGYANAYNNIGAAYAEKGRVDKALLFYSKAVELDPENAIAFDNRGVILKNQGRIDLAVQDFKKAIGLAPEYADAYNNLAAAYIDQGRIDEAIGSAQKALDLTPAFASARYNLGAAYFEKGETASALKNFNQAIELNPQYAAPYRGRAMVYYENGRLDQAIDDFSQAIKLKPRFAEAYNGRGACWQAKGMLDLAVRDYNIAIELKPDYAEPYYNRGLAYKAKGHPDLAEKDFTRAVLLDRKFAAMPR
jgi:protein O-mannosyl-transferase